MKLTREQKKLISEIKSIKSEKNAVILVHNYQRPEIYEVADAIGDSLGLCQQAAATDADMIVFCGVHFMAETAKILNPSKKVVIPHIDAGCAMAEMINADDLKKFRRKYPDAAVVCYVNSTAEVKAVSDICCTSSNAISVVRSLPNKQIIFVPDHNLASYVASQVKNKEIIAWKGYCPVHHFVNEDYVKEIKKEYPKAKLIAHPECKPEVIALSDYVESTSGMIVRARAERAKTFFILTECGMTERLNREIPGKEFFGLCNMCFDMKKTTLESVLSALISEKPVVRVDKRVANKAKSAIDKMMKVV